ncbi:MAG: M20/M25/M40 family metallo-hydrolase [Alphaproteobacteria bacterium]|jgi:acetylornithine deacetylase|nr:M20/M25/M40 family metallo-hydrolase [Alphaproteobacteria bacterium]
MEIDQVVAQVDEQASLDFLADMVRFKSYSGTEGETALARFMVEAMRQIGLEAEAQWVEAERYNAIGHLDGSGGGPSLLFNGHLDTNPVTEGWTVDPWGGLVDESFIYGIGVSNMKSGDAAYYSAVRTLREAGVKLKGDVILTYVVGELQGGVGTVKAIEEGARADYFVNSEPTDLQALTLHAGAFNFVVELTGETRHISKREAAVDAIAAACRLVPEINAMTFSGARDAEHLSINRANVGVLRGALSEEFMEWRPPQIADFARLVGTARYAPSQSKQSVLADLQGQLDRLEADFPGLKAVVREQSNDDGRPDMLPFEVDKGARIVQSLNAAYRAVRGGAQETGAFAPPCFYGTDAAHFLHRLGMEGVVCGPGGRYNTMPDERVDIPDYLDMIRIYMRVIIDICGVAEG